MEWNNGMEQFDSHIFNAITKLRNNKKQPNENSIYNSIAISGCLKCSFSSSGSFVFCQIFD